MLTSWDLNGTVLALTFAGLNLYANHLSKNITTVVQDLHHLDCEDDIDRDMFDVCR